MHIVYAIYGAKWKAVGMNYYNNETDIDEQFKPLILG